MYPSIPTRTDLVQAKAKHRPSCRFYEGGLSKDCRTRIPSNPPIADIFIADGVVSSERVSFLAVTISVLAHLCAAFSICRLLAPLLFGDLD